MHLLCSLSRHAAAPVTLENQGFLFSRCRRCNRDLICSSSGPRSWLAVPDGFRVAWRETDVSVFAHGSFAHDAWSRVRRGAATTRDAAHLAATVIGWRAADGARRMRTQVAEAYRTGRRTMRLPNLRKSGDTWVVIVNLTLRRDMSLEHLSLMLPDARTHAS